MTCPITEHTAKTPRHTTFYLACGAQDAPLIIFVHGWPELSISWRHQLHVFAALGWAEARKLPCVPAKRASLEKIK
jgi:pimeloyl-ACP methyl ester carboxylesterase